MSENTQLATRPQSVKDYLALPAYKDRFQEVLGKRANQFMAAITASSQLPGLKDAEPRSVIAAAMVAATLDLPVNPTLGQAHLVAYADNTGTKVAQFQIGYKGLIQLALRSGQYKRLNAGPVNKSVFKGYDLVGEPVLDWTAYDPTAETAGYFCAFETLNGFVKVVYWTKEQAEAHGRRFSRAYAKGYSTPWKSDFDSMATKTVIKAALGKWGLLSVEMQKAVIHDQGAQEDVDAEVKYVDGGEDRTINEEMPGDPPSRPAPPPRAAKGAAAVKENPKPVEAAAPAATVESSAQQARENGAVEGALPPAQSASPPPAAEPTPIPSTPEPRTRLNADEKFTANVEVVVLKPMRMNGRNKTTGATEPVPVVYAEVKGDYTGPVVHPEGAKVEGDEVVAQAPWKMGARLTLSLVGGKSPKAVVEKAEAQAEEF